MANEPTLKIVAKIKALETLVQHLVFLACDQDLDALRAYAQRVNEEAREATISGFDPAMSDHLAGEMQIALEQVLGDLIRRIEKEAR